MPNYLFDSFDEVEESIRTYAPKVIYKYRGDWNNSYHRKVITEQSLWFASPKELNDEYDIRTPIKFDISEIENPIFFEKLKQYYLDSNPGKGFTERDLNVICENKLDEIRQNPTQYFEKNYRDLRSGPIYERVGLFSCTSDELNELMWAHYGNSNTGFVVGFDTVELSRNLYCSIGPVKYSDEVPVHSFITPRVEGDFDSLFLKSRKWSYEKEFRFITIGDDEKIERLKHYSKESIVEFSLGTKFPENLKSDFIKEVKNIFSPEIPIFQVSPAVGGYGLIKREISL
ncbi:MAG: DUF2971 domain-containing protein [Sphingobacteriales bacterium]|nr:DUF2971 domain-containing protein [Sphingobacteriales bacterium]